MKRRTLLGSAAFALAALALPGCALGDDAAPDYRYRLTVEVDTPEGLRTGSSVIEVKQRLVRPGSNPAGTGVERRIRGEAVAIDLPGGRTLFALLRSEDNIDWASYVMVYLAPHPRGENFAEQLDNVLLVDGEVALPRMWPPVGHLPERTAYPMLVTFDDLADPASVALVDPDDMPASFGEGVTLRRITVQFTDEPVTSGVDEKLGWLGNYPEPSLDPNHGPRDFSLPATLHHGDFRHL